MTNSSPRIIWTAKAIGARIGRGSDFVRNTLTTMPGTPVKRAGGRIYVFEDDLIAFLRDADQGAAAERA